MSSLPLTQTKMVIPLKAFLNLELGGYDHHEIYWNTNLWVCSIYTVLSGVFLILLVWLYRGHGLLVTSRLPHYPGPACRFTQDCAFQCECGDSDCLMGSALENGSPQALPLAKCTIERRESTAQHWKRAH